MDKKENAKRLRKAMGVLVIEEMDDAGTVTTYKLHTSKGDFTLRHTMDEYGDEIDIFEENTNALIHGKLYDEVYNAWQLRMAEGGDE